MNTATYETHNFDNLSSSSRTARFGLTAIFIGIILTTSVSINILASLSLISVYLFTTGLIGWAPVKDMFHHQRTGAKKLNASFRIAYAVLASIAIGAVLVNPVTPLGWMAILPLIAVYPVFGAITGVDILDAWFNKGVIQDNEIEQDNKATIHYFEDSFISNLIHKPATQNHDKAA